ncbi:helix-turn-helix domain-containing protein [Ruminococcaceae bacterium OttesenSCG-928-L11]|nr:helix-turn-helix domain-containing protein [Ruminococcaceae bacterium OttesenSCG-928-L11]
MKIIGERLLALREGMKLSQAKLASLCGSTQANIYRYEADKTSPPFSILLWYADYFDVSMDYIFGRCDDPKGKLYEYKPDLLLEKAAKNDELRQFVEMCFDPNSPINGRLKEILVRMLQEGNQ